MIYTKRVRNQPARSVLYQRLDRLLVMRRKVRGRDGGIQPRSISERFMRRYPGTWQLMLAAIEQEQEAKRMAEI